MIILIIAATEMEIRDFMLQGLQKVKEEIKIELLITGIGAPLSIYQLTRQLSSKKYDMVIQAGIAGSFSKKYSNNTVVIVEKENFGDMGIKKKNNFTTQFETGLADANIFPFKNGWLVNEHPLLKKLSYPKVNGITINTVSDSKKQFTLYKTKFNAEIESMEGAALHLVCLQMNQSFLQIRSISNKVGERDKAKWDIKNAINNLNNVLLEIVNSLSNINLCN